MADHPNTAAWRWVPVEPTPEMRMAYHAVVETTVLGAAGSRWAAMLAAAPAPSLPPVRLPEPVAWLYHDAADVEALLANPMCHSALLGLERQPLYRNETPLYTADQLRAAVAADRLACAKARGE